MFGRSKKPPEKERRRSLPISVVAALSGLSGSFALLFSHPFELAKNRGILNKTTLREQCVMLRNDAPRLRDLWSGIGAGVARQAVYASLRLGWYEPIRNRISFGHSTTISQEPSMLSRAVAGALSGGVAGFCTSPIEVAVVVQADCSSDKNKISLFEAFRRAVRSNGVFGLWRGVWPLTARSAVVGVSQVAVYDHLRHKARKTKKNPITAVLGSAFTTGIFYSATTMPLEAARVRMCAETAQPPRFTSVRTTLLLVAKEQGALSLFNGFVPYAIRCTTHTVVMFAVLENALAIAKGAHTIGSWIY